MRRLIFDTANILFRVASGQSNNDSFQRSTKEEQAGLAMHSALNTIKKYVKLYKPDQIAVTFEGKANWRKEYTKSEQCISGKVYKANRIKDPSMDVFYELIAGFRDLVSKHSSLVCLANDKLEGDDLFAGYVKKFSMEGDTVIGVSGDKDFVQLLKYPNFQLINPDGGKPRTVLDVFGRDDIKFFMFDKCIRGDRGDNVASAFPNVRSTRLQKCLNDEYEMTKLMNETWSIRDEELDTVKEFVVGKLFEENKLLMDLESQPDDIKSLILDVIDHSLENRGKFNLFHFQKFCGKFKLEKISNEATLYAQLFSIGSKSSENKSPKDKLLEF